MRKWAVAVIALFLVIPAVTSAGTATSRWDLTIAGTVKFDVGFADQNVNSNYNAAQRKALPGQRSTNAHVGNFFMNGSESTLTFLVKGPDAMGAKTSAFIATDFTGQRSASNNGTLGMAQAKISMDWPTTSLTMGVQPQVFGLLPTYSGNTLGFNHFSHFDKGTPSIPHVILTKSFTKEWIGQLGALQIGQGGGGASATSTNNNWTRVGHPGVEGALKYTTDKLGKVGPWQTVVRLAGFWARERRTFGSTNDDFVNSWLADFTVLVPIIPENKGNKAGAFYVDALAFTSQNAGAFGPSANQISTTADGNPVSVTNTAFGSYQRPDGEWTAPVVSGYEAHASYYFTNTVWANVFYGHATANLSNRLRSLAANASSFQNDQHIYANILYDVNPAVRVGLEYVNIHTRYANFIFAGGVPVLDKKGTLNVVRAGAWYFF